MLIQEVVDQLKYPILTIKHLQNTPNIPLLIYSKVLQKRQLGIVPCSIGEPTIASIRTILTYNHHHYL